MENFLEPNEARLALLRKKLHPRSAGIFDIKVFPDGQFYVPGAEEIMAHRVFAGALVRIEPRAQIEYVLYVRPYNEQRQGYAEVFMITFDYHTGQLTLFSQQGLTADETAHQINISKPMIVPLGSFEEQKLAERIADYLLEAIDLRTTVEYSIAQQKPGMRI